MNKIKKQTLLSHVMPIFLLLSVTLLSGCLASKPSVSESHPDTSETEVSMEQRVMPPQWQVGDNWQYSDGYALQVSGVDNGMTTFDRTDVSDQWIRRKAFFKEESQSKKTYRKVVYRSKDPQQLFPLSQSNKVTFKREYMADGNLRVHRTSWEVLDEEVITVPAGKFKCWVIEMKTKSTTGDWSGHEKWWYSPLVKNYVRMEYKYGISPESSRVLTAYSTQ